MKNSFLWILVACSVLLGHPTFAQVTNAPVNARPDCGGADQPECQRRRPPFLKEKSIGIGQSDITSEPLLSSTAALLKRGFIPLGELGRSLDHNQTASSYSGSTIGGAVVMLLVRPIGLDEVFAALDPNSPMILYPMYLCKLEIVDNPDDAVDQCRLVK